jgi:hypothetical protein
MYANSTHWLIACISSLATCSWTWALDVKFLKYAKKDSRGMGTERANMSYLHSVIENYHVEWYTRS